MSKNKLQTTDLKGPENPFYHIDIPTNETPQEPEKPEKTKNIGVTQETHRKIKAVILAHPKYYGKSIKELVDEWADECIAKL